MAELTDHGRCRWASRAGMDWRCVACGEPLGFGVAFFQPTRGLTLRPVRHGTLRAYGPNNATRLRGAAGSRAYPPAVLTGGDDSSRVAVYVYCPRRGCGVGQHVTTTP